MPPPGGRERNRRRGLGEDVLDVDLSLVWKEIVRRAPEEFRVSVRRPDDLLVLDLVFENLQLSGEAPPALVRRNPSAGAYLLAEFPPQSFAEEAFLDATGSSDTSDKEVSKHPDYPKKNQAGGAPAEDLPNQLPLARVRMSGRSRVGLRMPAEETALPYTLPDVLRALRTWPMRLDITAAPDPEIRREELLELDRHWLGALAAGLAWEAASAALAIGLAERGVERLERPLAQAGRRVAELTAGVLTQGSRRTLSRDVAAAMEAELARLTEQFPALVEPTARSAAVAALALESTRALAGRGGELDVDAEALARLPYLQLLLAPHEPSAGVTALELPHRLILSPLGDSRWRHSDTHVEHRGRTELWHTRLSTGEGEAGADGSSKVRAIWSPDYPTDDPDLFPLLDPPQRPFRATLDPLDRKLLVRLMAGFGERVDARRAYRPRSSLASRLALSSLGGLLEVEGNWTTRPEGVDLEQWRHLATLGRDHYVRVVYAGFLCPFGHAASLIKVTERKFEPLGDDPTGERVTVLRQRFFIAVREPFKLYDGSRHVFDGNTFPFTAVEILSRVTPNLQEPGSAPTRIPGPEGAAIYALVPARAAFWPMVSPSEPFPFDLAATDLCGNRVTFSLPLLFVGENANFPATTAALIRDAYGKAPGARRLADTGGATICFAPPAPPGSDSKGDPRLPAASLVFRADDVSGPERFKPTFYPAIAEAQIGIRAVQRLLGQSNALVGTAYADVYRDKGFGAGNEGEVFLRTLTDYALDFGDGPGKPKSDALGALVSPSMGIAGLSRIAGPVGDVGTAAANSFDPLKFFDAAKILGGIPLETLLGAVPLSGPAAPRMLARELAAEGDLPARVEASFTWRTEIAKSDPAGLFVPRANPAAPTTLDMSGVVTTPVGEPAAASFEANARLENFKVNLFGFIVLWFDLLRFEAKRGQKPDVVVDLHPGDDAIVFGGPLEFVNGLRSLIPSGGFSDPPSLTVTPSGIAASYSLNLPNVEVGIFALSNASLGAGFSLPFDARPASVRFNFSERQHPFSLTVSLFGGGGFFAIGIGSAGVQEIEAALEFGAAVAIDLGVASGGVEIKAGVYFHWLEPVSGKGSVELAGYVRLHGELTLLGIFSASLTFNLQLGYLKEGGESIVSGEATLVVEIEILFLSMDVSVSCRREFAGSESDPGFVELIPNQTTWSRYCNAFAEEAA